MGENKKYLKPPPRLYTLPKLPLAQPTEKRLPASTVRFHHACETSEPLRGVKDPSGSCRARIWDEENHGLDVPANETPG